MGANLGCDVGRVCYFIVSGEVMEAIMVVGERAMMLMASSNVNAPIYLVSGGDIQD